MRSRPMPPPIVDTREGDDRLLNGPRLAEDVGHASQGRYRRAVRLKSIYGAGRKTPGLLPNAKNAGSKPAFLFSASLRAKRSNPELQGRTGLLRPLTLLAMTSAQARGERSGHRPCCRNGVAASLSMNRVTMTRPSKNDTISRSCSPPAGPSGPI